MYEIHTKEASIYYCSVLVAACKISHQTEFSAKQSKIWEGGQGFTL